jgi:2-polyprenyl-3-methyl-5-hydroxy-6-metoxy-1,4-benzoquinol methylase
MKLGNLRYVDRPAFIRDICRGKSVLNLGCADATRVEKAVNATDHIHVVISQVAARLVGVDLNQTGLDKLKASTGLKDLVCYDVEKIGELAPQLGAFDVVVVGELIEHLNNPGLMLGGIRKLLKEGGKLVLTTPNAMSVKFFLHGLLRRRDVSSDFHTVIFSFKTLAQLLDRYDYEPQQWAVAQWHHPGFRNRLFRPLMNLVFKIFPQCSDTLLCVATPRKARPTS